MRLSVLLRGIACALLLVVLFAGNLPPAPVQGQSPTATPTVDRSQSSERRSSTGPTGRITYVTRAEGGKYAGRPVLYIVDPDGKNRKLLTCKEANYIDYKSPTWSPDGRLLAFTWNKDIYVMDAEGENLRKLTTDPASDDAPAWSPDGRFIAFASDRGDFRDIYIIDADGRNERRLTDNGADNDHPTWSPDGQRIAFASNLESGWQIYVMDADGSAVRRLSNVEAGDCKDPVWSPDGRHIAFVSAAPEQVFVMSADGLTARQVSESGGFNKNPSWSPDSQYIAFSRFGNIPGSAHSFGILIAALDGTNPQPILTSKMPVEEFTWSKG